MEKNTKGIKAFLHDAKAVSPAIATLILIVIAAVAAAGVGFLVNNAQKNAQDQTQNKDLSVSGTLNIKGSTTIMPITQAAATEFEKQYPSVVINVAGGSSGAGRYLAFTTTNPTNDIGASSEVWPPTKDTSFNPNVDTRDNAVIQAGSSTSANVWETKIGTGMIVVAYNKNAPGAPATPVDMINGASAAGKLGYADLVATYSTGVAVPAGIGFTSGAANTLVYYRSASSGTQDTFMKWLNPTGWDANTKLYTPAGGAIPVGNFVGKGSNEEIRDAIDNCPAGDLCVGFVDQSFATIDGNTGVNGKANVIGMTQNGKSAIAANKNVGGIYDGASKTVSGGTKGLARDLYYYNQGTPSGAMKTFLDWMLSIKGQNVITAQGFFNP